MPIRFNPDSGNSEGEAIRSEGKAIRSEADAIWIEGGPGISEAEAMRSKGEPIRIKAAWGKVDVQPACSRTKPRFLRDFPPDLPDPQIVSAGPGLILFACHGKPNNNRRIAICRRFFERCGKRPA